MGGVALQSNACEKAWSSDAQVGGGDACATLHSRGHPWNLSSPCAHNPDRSDSPADLNGTASTLTSGGRSKKRRCRGRLFISFT